MSASNIRTQFVRTGSRPSSDFYDLAGDQNNGSAEPPERTALLSRLHEDEHEHRVATWVFMLWYTSWEVLNTNYVNVLLVFLPFAVISSLVNWSPTIQFALNFVAIIPLSSLIAYACEELSVYLGQSLGGILNATFGNVVELIVGIVALQYNEIRIVQSAVLGNIFSNLVLLPGCCCLAGGLLYMEQNFDYTITSTMSFFAVVAIITLLTPTALHSVALDVGDQRNTTTFMSHGSAIVLLLIYITYLLFQIKTHAVLFENAESMEEEYDAPLLKPWLAGIFLAVTTALVALCAHNLLGSLSVTVEKAHINRTFIGFILFPFLGNTAEYVTSVIVAYKNRVDLAICVAIGSVLQTILFVVPTLVIIGWIMGRHLTLSFGIVETVAVLFSSLVMAVLLQHGRSNYLDGVLCLGMYSIVVMAFYGLSEQVN